MTDAVHAVLPEELVVRLGDRPLAEDQLVGGDVGGSRDVDPDDRLDLGVVTRDRLLECRHEMLGLDLVESGADF